MQWDEEAQLYHTWFRKYDPNQGRWMSFDPLPGSLEDAQSLNRYTYARNDPVNYKDPLGRECYGYHLWFVHLIFEGDIVVEEEWVYAGFIPVSCTGGSRGGSGGGSGGGTSGNGDSKDGDADKIKETCDAIRANGGGRVPEANTLMNLSFDASGYLNGIIIQATTDKRKDFLMGNTYVSVQANTRIGVGWNNGPAPVRLEARANNSIWFSPSPATSASIISIMFDLTNGFQVEGSAAIAGLPIGGGIIENKLNRDLSLVQWIADLATKLRNNPIPCETILGYLGVASPQ
jgi:RHS repeat-associated protein